MNYVTAGTLLAAIFVTAICHAQLDSARPPGSLPREAPGGFIIGADISWLQAAEDRGVKFSENGIEKDILEILTDHGFNYLRLRVFHDAGV